MAEDAFGIVGSLIAATYQVEAAAAEGGFGTIYKAHHRGFGAPVALKCLRLPPALPAHAQQQFLDAFRAEAQLLFRLSATIPTVVRPLHVDAFTTTYGRFVPYLVLEWLNGETLQARIRRLREQGKPPLSLEATIQLLTPVARALERAHHFEGDEGRLAIVHRDLKPENIFLALIGGEETPKILDFGIAKAKTLATQVAGRASVGPSGFSSFTPAYGSPEQWAPRRYGQTGPWTDVWGLALTMVETLAGRAVIDGDPAAMMGTILDPHRRPTPRAEGVNVPAAVEQVFARALALEPAERQPDAGVFWNELLTAVGQRGAHASAPRPSFGRPVIDVDDDAPFITPSQRPPVSQQAAQATLRREAAAVTELAPAAERAAAKAPTVTRPAASAAMAAPQQFEVPDLDLPPPVSRQAERARVSAAPPPAAPELDFDELPGNGGESLALDLPKHDPLLRRASSGGLAAVRFEELQPATEGSLPPIAPALSSSPAPMVSSQVPASLRPEPDRSGLREPEPRASSPAMPLGVAAGSSGPRPAGFGLAPRASASLRERILPGVALVALAMGVTLLDQLYAAITGETFSIGPVRTNLMSGAVLLLGLGLIVYRFKSGRDPA